MKIMCKFSNCHFRSYDVLDLQNKPKVSKVSTCMRAESGLLLCRVTPLVGPVSQRMSNMCICLVGKTCCTALRREYSAVDHLHALD